MFKGKRNGSKQAFPFRLGRSETQRAGRVPRKAERREAQPGTEWKASRPRTLRPRSWPSSAVTFSTGSWGSVQVNVQAPHTEAEGRAGEGPCSASFSDARYVTYHHHEPVRGGSPYPVSRPGRAGSETGSNLPQITQVTGLCNPVALKATSLPGFLRPQGAPSWRQHQCPYPRSWKSWLARRPRGPGRPTLSRWALGSRQACVAFVAWDSRVPRLAIPTRSSFVTFDPGISLEEEKSVSANKWLEGAPSRQDWPGAGDPQSSASRSSGGETSVLAQVRTRGWTDKATGPRSHRQCAGAELSTPASRPPPSTSPGSAAPTAHRETGREMTAELRPLLGPSVLRQLDGQRCSKTEGSRSQVIS